MDANFEKSKLGFKVRGFAADGQPIRPQPEPGNLTFEGATQIGFNLKGAKQRVIVLNLETGKQVELGAITQRQQSLCRTALTKAETYAERAREKETVEFELGPEFREIKLPEMPATDYWDGFCRGLRDRLDGERDSDPQFRLGHNRFDEKGNVGYEAGYWWVDRIYAGNPNYQSPDGNRP